MSQTAYVQNLVVGRAGMLADNGNRDVLSGVAPTDVIPFGCGVAYGGTADRNLKLPAAATDITGQGTFRGIALISLSVENARDNLTANYPALSEVSVLKKGRAWVAVEEAVTPTSKVFVRYATGIADNTLTQKGAFRASGDGTSQVDTLTPTAVNSTQYFVSLNGQQFNYLSDSSATATEIVTGFKTAINAETAVHGVTASGTTTLVLTGLAGVGFTTEADPNMAIVNTTAVAGSAAQLANARYLTTQATPGGLAIVEINIP